MWPRRLDRSSQLFKVHLRHSNVWLHFDLCRGQNKGHGCFGGRRHGDRDRLSFLLPERRDVRATRTDASPTILRRNCSGVVVRAAVLDRPSACTIDEASFAQTTQTSAYDCSWVFTTGRLAGKVKAIEWSSKVIIILLRGEEKKKKNPVSAKKPKGANAYYIHRL